MFIRSERLFLRPGWPEDWPDLLARIADEAVVKNLAKAPWPYTAADARWFAEQPQDARCPHFFVTLPDSSSPAELVGCVGLARDGDDVELGYWVGRDYWGRGYATEAGRAVLRLARALGHQRIVAKHYADNPASGRVLRKLGFRATGEVRPSYSRARGCNVPGVVYTLKLGATSDCDGSGDDDGLPAMRAA